MKNTTEYRHRRRLIRRCTKVRATSAAAELIARPAAAEADLGHHRYHLQNQFLTVTKHWCRRSPHHTSMGSEPTD